MRWPADNLLSSKPQGETPQFSDLPAADPYERKYVPLLLKAVGIFGIVGAALYGYGLVFSVIDAVEQFRSGALNAEGVSTIAVTFVHLADLVALVVALIVLGVRLLTNRRRYAAQTISAIIALLVLNGACVIMLYGIDRNIAFVIVVLVLLVALRTYLDPVLAYERRAQIKRRSEQDRRQKAEGTLGRDESGHGYIQLNFFNLFWIFVLCSVLGLVMETVYHAIQFHDYQDRAGMLFGPFSPIYGVGAVLMTLALNRFYRANLLVIFLVSALIGGAFEYFTSWFMQYAFGAVAWDYSNMPLSIGGRTCGPFMAIWGFLGVVWIRLLLPWVLRTVNLIPWNWRYGVTAVAAVLMLVNAVMTLQALDCWYERLSGAPITSHIQQFYAAHFDDAEMAERFQSMSIHPESALRGK